MKVNNNNKKGSNAKKIIPAVGMLSVSAVMLASSTFAWFTMSREVDVTGLNMTATVPEDLQISLGTIGTSNSAPETSETGMALVKSTGYLVKDTNASNADNGTVLAPTHSWDWSNSADISAYYRFGKLMPASSTTGEKIYFTPDASGVGRTVKGIAKYYAANTEASGSNLTAVADENASATNVTNKTYAATLHALTNKTIDSNTGAITPNDGWINGDAPTYAPSTDWNKTCDDGYYIDVPVWIRSSGSTDTNISVAGYVLPGSTDTTSGKSETDLELYRAVRVAILNGDTAGKANSSSYDTAVLGSATGASSKNVIPLIDAWDKENSSSTGTNPVLYKSIATANTPFTAVADTSQVSILDSGIYDERMSLTGGNAGKLWGVSSLTTYTEADATADLSGYINSTDSVKATYAEYTAYDGTAIATIKCAANSGDDYANSKYGVPKKLIIRVWLDGEDTQCWNDNAGQDWAISLKFSKIESNS